MDKKQRDALYRTTHKKEAAEYGLKWRKKNQGAIIQYRKDYLEKNKEALDIEKKAWYKKNRDKVLARASNYHKKNRGRIQEYNKKYRNINREKLLQKAKLKYQDNPQTKMAANLRSSMGTRLRRAGFKESFKVVELIGCSFSELREYLEKQFDTSMNWGNYNLRGWHVDHIKPCKLFDLTNPEERKACFHFSNLQPLWAKDNWSKGAKYKTEA